MSYRVLDYSSSYGNWGSHPDSNEPGWEPLGRNLCVVCWPTGSVESSVW